MFTVTGGLVIVAAAALSAVAPRPPVPISPGQHIQAIVDAHPQGTAFLLKKGLHRMQSVVPKDGDSFTGEAGAVMCGARLLTAFARSGRYWIAMGLTAQPTRSGQCDVGYGGCAYPNDLYVDDAPLKHVPTLGQVAPGAWYFDYATGTLYLADDPAGRKVEWSVTEQAFSGPANNVTISNLIIEKYANPAQHGAVHGDGTRGWVVQGNEVRRNHGAGIRAGAFSRIVRNNVHHNGQLGIGGSACSTVLVEANEIASNNTLHFSSDWEAGGTKFTLTSDLIVRANYSHHNHGPGLWTDIDNIRTTYEQNRVEDNDNAGIEHEISYAAVIRNNTVRRNGFAHSTWLWGAGILVAASPDVEVYGNTVENNANGIGAVQQKRGGGKYGLHEVRNLFVHGNKVVMQTGRTGLVQDVGDRSYFTSRNNRFDSNSYTLGPTDSCFDWMDGHHTFAEWRAYGQDANAVVNVRR